MVFQGCLFVEEITGVAHHAFGHPLWPVAAARLANLGKDMDRWREMIGRLREEYKEQYCFDSGRGERVCEELLRSRVLRRFPHGSGIRPPLHSG